MRYVYAVYTRELKVKYRSSMQTVQTVELVRFRLTGRLPVSISKHVIRPGAQSSFICDRLSSRLLKISYSLVSIPSEIGIPLQVLTTGPELSKSDSKGHKAYKAK